METGLICFVCGGQADVIWREHGLCYRHFNDLDREYVQRLEKLVRSWVGDSDMQLVWKHASGHFAFAATGHITRVEEKIV